MNDVPLEEYYPGDDAWIKFSQCFDNEWEKCPSQSEVLQSVSGEIDIAKVVYGSFLAGYSQWLEMSVPALSDSTPTECLKTEIGEKRLKTMLMRMPR